MYTRARTHTHKYTTYLNCITLGHQVIGTRTSYSELIERTIQSIPPNMPLNDAQARYREYMEAIVDPDGLNWGRIFMVRLLSWLRLLIEYFNGRRFFYYFGICVTLAFLTAVYCLFYTQTG